MGDGTVKKILISVLEEELAPIRERRKQWEQDIPGVFEILRRGSQEARAVAAAPLADVRRAMRINYFDDPKLIAEQAAKYAGKLRLDNTLQYRTGIYGWRNNLLCACLFPSKPQYGHSSISRHRRKLRIRALQRIFHL